MRRALARPYAVRKFFSDLPPGGQFFDMSRSEGLAGYCLLDRLRGLVDDEQIGELSLGADCEVLEVPVFGLLDDLQPLLLELDRQIGIVRIDVVELLDRIPANVFLHSQLAIG